MHSHENHGGNWGSLSSFANGIPDSGIIPEKKRVVWGERVIHPTAR
jgi:hypothetical protein